MRCCRFHLAVIAIFWLTSSVRAQPFPGTELLEGKEDRAAKMVAGIDKYLSREVQLAAAQRRKLWDYDFSSPEAYVKSVDPNRERFKKMIGVIDPRVPVRALEFTSTTRQPALIAVTPEYKVFTVRWPVLPGVHGEGLLLEPKRAPLARVVAIPDADWTPEMLAGLAPGVAPKAQFARILAASGCRVVIPTLINRQDTWSENPIIGRATNQTHREFVYRMSFEMGRHIIGYEVQKVLALVDLFSGYKEPAPIGVMGYGEGGLLALYSGAIDTRIKVTAVSGYFGSRDNLWQEPIYRNVWGLLREFGDGELMSLIMPRAFIAEAADFQFPSPPEARQGRGGAAPGFIRAVSKKETIAEMGRIMKSVPKSFQRGPVQYYFGLDQERGPNAFHGPGYHTTLQSFMNDLAGRKTIVEGEQAKDARGKFDPNPRQKRQLDDLTGYTQKLLPEAARRRQQFIWNRLDVSSAENYEKSTEKLRDYFWEDIVGKLPAPSMPMNPRTRLIYETPKWKGYEVVLDLYPDVFSYGILLVPNDIKPGEKRPVVVCQHGLEGRPTDVVNPNEKTRYYNSFGAQLADRGFIVFAPQNPYIGQNTFRQVARKANTVKLNMYSFIVRQHERILQWLSSLPFVDSARIAYYGLSYGGKVAMRIPAILRQYCLSICSGDFNEWIWKNITLDWIGSYMFTVEYEMYEFDLGNTFNYAEMAALIAPRPFMVERGHDDGVGLDEYVAFEYAKVRRLYSRLRLPERTAIEFFAGGHEINGRETFAFLHRHLNWPAPK